MIPLPCTPSPRRPFRAARAARTWLTSLAVLSLVAAPAAASGIHYDDVTSSLPEVAAFHRVPSATIANARAFQALGTVFLPDFIGPFPIKPHGAPGVALLDYDGDGDLDLYATNGPGGANGLFSNLLAETGVLDFVDVAVAAGVDATDQDSTGVCFGDIDNDGDPDLYVLGRSEPDRLFENLGDGTFADITAASGTGGGNLMSSSCSMADFDGDGLLDIVVGHSFDMATNLPIFVVPYALSEPNQLFLSAGANTFVDASASSGVGAVQEITWAVAAVDLNQDGFVDILTANDNGTIPFAASGGIDRGLLRYLVNDGTGHFTDVTHAVGLDTPGDWMGLAFADFDSNGTIDLFASNSGDWIEDFLGVPGSSLGAYASRWHLQRPDGTFADPGMGAMVAGGFSWGTSALDYDNDGDSDLVFYGGIDAGPFVDASNPGSLAENDGAAGFTYDLGALIPTGAPHDRRVENGLAVGDLDADGFPDIVSISGANLPTQPFGPIPYPQQWGSPIDGLAVLFPTWSPGTLPNQFVYSGVELPLGTVAVELNSGDLEGSRHGRGHGGGHRNGWIAVTTRGSVDDAEGARVPRDGYGAVIRVTPAGGSTAIRPVLGGSSYASQNARELTFGLGAAHRATVEVLWPGGVRNRLYDVRAGERIVFPEVPCSFDDPDATPTEYAACVVTALGDLVSAGAIHPGERGRYLGSALRAFAESRRGD
jgi:hypothetical protein